MRLCLFALSAAVLTVHADPLELVKNGKSDYVILVKPAALPATMAAAEDFQRYIEKSTGARLPLRKAEKAEGPAVKIGFLKVGKPEGFVIRSEGKDLHISGNDTGGMPYGMNWWVSGANARCGTWSGVCDFLEKQLGIRWFFPGELGEYVPKRDRLIVPELNYSDAPKMGWREISWLVNWRDMPQSDRVAMYAWKRHNRVGFHVFQRHTHAWGLYFNPKDHFDAHPDWFAMLNGRRSKINLYSHEPAMMCTSHPEAVKAFAGNIVKLCTEKPCDMFPISPNDGGGFCECPKCRALDKINPDGSRNMSNRIFSYGNALAKEVNKHLPDQMLGLYAYSYFVDPPDFDLDPHISICNVHNSCSYTYHDPGIRAAHLEQLLQWRKRAKHMHFLTFPEGMGCLNTPVYNFNGIKMLFANLRKAGIDSVGYAASTGFGASGLNKYMVARLLWDPECDIDAVYADALDGAYGGAASLVRDYFAEVERRIARFYTEGRVSEDVSLGTRRIFPGLYERCFPGLADAWLSRLKAARQNLSDSGQNARLGMLIDVLEYTELGVQLHRISKKVSGTPKPETADLVAALKLMERRGTLEERMHRLPDNMSVAGVRSYEKEAMPYFSAAVYKNLLAARTQKRVRVKRIAEPVRMDGRLEEAFWKDLPELLIDLDMNEGEKRPVGAVAKLALTENSLLVGVCCSEPKVSEMTDSVTRRNGPVWSENSIDLFLDPSCQGKNYYHLISNSLGTLFTAKCGTKDSAWTPEIQTAVFRGKDFWSIEIAIPLKTLSDRPVHGSIWGFNINRARRVGQMKTEYTCWSPTFGGFDQPARFGRIILE